jgi:hypothetical protein
MPARIAAPPLLAPADELLLRAAESEIHNTQELLTEWKRLRGWKHYDEIDFGSMLLLPRVYRRLVRAQAGDPWLPQLAALNRYHWLKNTNRLNRVLPVLCRIESAGARPLVAGSLALVAGGYLADAAECPEMTPEIVLRPADGLAARQVLLAEGWHCRRLPPVPGWRSEIWSAQKGVSLRVHYQWLPRPSPVVGAAAILPRARWAEYGGVALLLPSVTDLVAQTCLTAACLPPQSGWRTVCLADAIRLLSRHAEEINWPQLFAPTQPTEVLRALASTLEYLAGQFCVRVPESMLPIAGTPSAAPARGSTIPWSSYVRAEQAAERVPSSLGALRYAAWRIAAPWTSRPAAVRSAAT